jgi:opacity protein-like surface antigen
MKSLIAAFAFSTILAGSALASDPMSASRSGLYFGGSVGSSTSTNSRVGLGADVGVQFGPYVRAELDLMHSLTTVGEGNVITGNLIGQYRIPNSSVTPYVLVGVGYAFNNVSDIKAKSGVPVYNVGAGVTVALSKSVEVDARYRNIRTFDAQRTIHGGDNVMTVGLNYRF